MKIINKKGAILSLLLSFIFLSVKCQTTFNERIDYYNSLNTSGSIVLLNDTCYIPCGVLKPGSSNWWEVAMIKLDMNGSYQKGNTYGSDKFSYLAGGLDVIYFNNTILCSGVAGDSVSFPYGSIQATCFQFDKNNLDSVKFKIFTDTTFYNSFSALKKIDDTKMVLYGTTDSTCGVTHSYNYKPIIYVVDTAGSILFKKEYLSTCMPRIADRIDITHQNGFVICGFEQTPGFTTGSAFVIKIDSLGNQLWQKYYGNISTTLSSVITTKTYGYILATNENDSSYMNNWIWSSLKLYRLNESGDTLWTKKIGTKSQGFTPTDIKQLPNYDFIISGVRTVPHYDINGSLVSEQLYGFLCRTDSAGNVKWFNDYRGSAVNDTSAQNYLCSVIQAPDGGFIAVGDVGPTDGSTQDTWVIKVDSMGCLVPGCNGNLGVTTIHIGEPEFIIYPNPTNDFIDVETNFKNCTVSVFDVLGNLILKEKIIQNKTRFNLSGFSNGLYFMTLQGDDKIISKKFMTQ